MNTIACPGDRVKPSNGGEPQSIVVVVTVFKQLFAASLGKRKANVASPGALAHRAVTLDATHAAPTPGSGSSVDIGTGTASAAPPVQSVGEWQTSNELGALPTTRRPLPAGLNEPARSVGDSMTVRVTVLNGRNPVGMPGFAAARADTMSTSTVAQSVTPAWPPATVVTRNSSAPPGMLPLANAITW